MKFKGLVVLSLVILSIFSLSYAFGPRFGRGYQLQTSFPDLTKISGTISKIYNAPSLNIVVKTSEGEKTVLVGPAWLIEEFKDLKLGAKVEVEGFQTQYANVFRALKVTVDGKKILDLTERNYGFGRRFGYMGCCR